MSDKPRVLLVEDDADWLEIYRDHLQSEDYLVNTARSIRTAIELLQTASYDVVVTDLKMLGFGDDFGGFSVLQKTKELSPDTQVIVITAYGTRDIAMRAMQQGAFDYVVKPPDAERFRLSVRGAIQARRVVRAKRSPTPGKADISKESAEYDLVPEAIVQRQAGLFGIIGNSEGMRTVFEQMSKAIGSSVPILIWGESGTGKQLIARTIHANGQRRTRPFSYKSCTELFSPTHWSAITRNLNRLKGGTLFLDDLARLDPENQGALEDIVPNMIMNEIRVMASVCGVGRELPEISERQRVRSSLFQSIGQMMIYVPPLRHRRDGDDIPALIGHFIHAFTENMQPKPQITVSSTAMKLLLDHDYLGANVRELYDIINSAVNLLGGDGTIMPEHLLVGQKSLQAGSIELTEPVSPTHPAQPAMGLPLDIYTRCRDVLLKCSEFDSQTALHAVFVLSDLRPYLSGIPDAASKGERVSQSIAYLLQQRLVDGRPVLPMFLAALQSRRDENDSLRDELKAVADSILRQS